MTDRSDKWDKFEKIGWIIGTLKKSIFNVPLLILIGLFVFGATFAYVYFVMPPAYAGESMKIFEDGIIYEGCDGTKWFSAPCTIHYKGESYDCKVADGYGDYLSPKCIEVIMRSIP